MHQKTIIEVNHVSKKFCKDLKHTIKYGFADIGKNILGLNSGSDKLREQEFWALNNVSFNLKKGETLGIIGPNGSGKSTLLKLLNGIFPPDKGTVKIKGKVGALIEVGAGFHPMLTGRENIYINASILGMAKKQIDKKFDEIVEFADIGDFLDTPVKNYSSGMHVRLGFAIAIHSDPEILLVDEILAVGDYNFQRKCSQKIKEKVREGMSLILVSHTMGNILGSTAKAILLDKGKKIFESENQEVVRKYLDRLNLSLVQDQKQTQTPFRRGSGEVRIIDAFVVDSKGRKAKELLAGTPIKIKCLFKTHKPIIKPVFFFTIRDVITRQTVLFASSENRCNITKLKKDGEFSFIFNKPNIVPRTYYLCGGILNAGNYDTPVDIWDDAGERFVIKYPNSKKVANFRLIADSLIELPYKFMISLKR